MRRQTVLFSYVVQHDTGYAPNPFYRVCTLCRCKYRTNKMGPMNIVELAEKGDWIVGTGGKDKRKSAGHGRLVYAMRVDEKLTREEYYSDPRFAKKKPRSDGTYMQKQGDNLCPDDNYFERYQQFVLISRHFYYFGVNAIPFRKKFANLEKKGPGFKKFDSSYAKSLEKWLADTQTPGIRGKPCRLVQSRRAICKSFC